MELIEPWKTLFTDQVRYLDTLVIGHCNKRTQVKCVLQNLATKININLSIFAIQARLKRQKKLHIIRNAIHTIKCMLNQECRFCNQSKGGRNINKSII